MYRIRLITVAMLVASSLTANADTIYDAGPLDFSTDGQSMWAPGDAIQFADSFFLGAEWSNRTGGTGGIAGSANATNPLWTAWNLTCPLCLAALEPSRTIDTRTGAKIEVTTSGKFGLEFGYTLDSGSVNAASQLSATAVLPGATLTQGEFFNLNPMSSLVDGSISSQSPWAEAYVDAIAQFSGSVTATGCGIPLGCASGTLPLPTVDAVLPIVTVDPNSIRFLPELPSPLVSPLYEIALLNQEATLSGTLSPIPSPPFVAPGFRLEAGGITLVDTTVAPVPTLDIELASLEVQAPNIATNGGLDGSLLKSSGRDDIITAKLDIDAVGTMSGALPPTGIGLTLIDVPGIKASAQFDALDVKAGPVAGLTQDFELDPTLMVQLDFSTPVAIQGLSGSHMSWTGAWESLPFFALLQETTFSPTFWLDAMLTNSLGIDLGLVGTLDLFKIGAGVSVAGIDILEWETSLNEILGFDNELFSTPKLRIPIYENSFALGGFNQVQAAAFSIGVSKSGPVQVPEPGTLSLLMLGVGVLALSRRRKQFVIGGH